MARVEKTVFVRHRRKDRSGALAVYQHLYSQKYDVFLDSTGPSSEDFEQVVSGNIRGPAHFLLTPTALDRCATIQVPAEQSAQFSQGDA